MMGDYYDAKALTWEKTSKTLLTVPDEIYRAEMAAHFRPAAAPDSREELKARIDAMTCEGCRLGLEKWRGSHKEIIPPGRVAFDLTPLPCTAKGAEILALLPALKSEGDAETEAEASFSAYLAEKDSSEAVTNSQTDRSSKASGLSGPPGDTAAPPVAAQVDEAEVREWLRTWHPSSNKSVYLGDVNVLVEMLLDFARTHPGNQLAPSGQLEAKLQQLIAEWVRIEEELADIDHRIQVPVKWIKRLCVPVPKDSAPP